MSSLYRISAQIDLDAFEYNVNQIKKKIGPNVGIMAVVKANAYGHGSLILSRELERLGAAWLAVACVDEAVELRQGGIKLPILILGYTAPDEYEDLFTYQITPTVFSWEAAKGLDEMGAKRGQVLPIHIKIDTGLHRIGYPVTEESAQEIIRISQLEHVKVEGIFTHFACADMAGEVNQEKTRKQYADFMQMKEWLLEGGLTIPIWHCANSAALMVQPTMHLDLVRAGIVLYGLYPSKDVDAAQLPVRPVMSLKSHVTFVKILEAGAGVSYSHIYVTKDKTVVATVSAGYADGYPRRLSNKSSVLIHGKRAPVLGKVCMDQIMIDVTGIPDVKVGDEVTLVGRDGEETITMDELAEHEGSITYELVCDIGRRVPRVYIKDGKVCEITHCKTVYQSESEE